MASFLDQPEGTRGDFIIRTGWNMLRLETREGAPFDLIAALERMRAKAAAGPGEWVVQVPHGRGKRLRRLRLRLTPRGAPPGCIPLSSWPC